MIIKHKFSMDLDRMDPEKCIHVMQDDKYSRDLVIALKSGSKAFVLPDGCTVLIRYKKPSGRGGVYDTMPDGSLAWSIAENELTVRLAPQVCTEPGDVKLIVTLLQGEAELSCFAVTVRVQEGQGEIAGSEAYINARNFIPQPGSAVLGQYLKVLETDELGRITAVETAAVAAGSGTEGKSAYEYAQEGGYTGTEAEFSKKLAQEVPAALPNPHKLTLNGQSYDGSDDVQADTREFVFHVTGTMENGYTADTTYGEVLAAHNAGRSVLCMFTGEMFADIYLNRMMYSEGMFIFMATPMPGCYVMCSLMPDDSVSAGEAMTDIRINGIAWTGETSVDFTDTIHSMIRAETDALTASDVGALPDTTVIPVVPSALKNPSPLTINGVSYDGSKAVSLTVSTENVPDYVKTEADRLAAVVQSRQNENTLSAILSADYHLPNAAHAYYPQILESITHAGQAMEILRKKLSVDFEAKLGDLLWDSGETRQEALGNFQKIHGLVSAGKDPDRFEANGNHDHLQSNAVPLTDSQVYANLGIFHKDCVRDPANRVGGYCYKDYETFRLRVILLNTSEADDGSFTVSSAQLAWLEEALAVPVEEGWGTLILSHHPLDWGGSSTAVMNRIKAASGVVANLHGHVHTYTQDVLTGTEIPRLAIPNVCFHRNNEYGTNGTTENSEGIEFGTTTTYKKIAESGQDTAFCVLTLDREAGKLYLDHYGAGIDRQADVITWTKSGYTNLVPVSEAADSTAVYNGTGYKNGVYLSSNGAGQESTDSACVTTGYIPYSWAGSNPIYVKGAAVTDNSHCRIYGHSSKSYINQSCMATGANMSTHFTVEELVNGNYYKLTPVGNFSEVTYVRLSLIGSGENLVITVNEPIEG